MKLLFSTLIAMFSMCFVYAQDSIQHLDTLVHMDHSKEVVNVVSFSHETVEYQIENDSTNHIMSLANLDHVIFRDGSTIGSKNKASLKHGQLKTIVPRKELPNKRAKHLIINTNILTLVRMSPYGNRTFNIGAAYFLNSNFSIHGQFYYGTGSTPSASVFYFDPYYSVSLDNGYEFGFGYLGSTTKKLDYGFRTGIIFSNLHQQKQEYYSYSIYSEVDNGNYPTNYNGKDYYHVGYDYVTNYSTIEAHSLDIYAAFEANLKLSNRVSLFWNMGLKSAKNKDKYDGGYYRYYVTRLLDMYGNVEKDLVEDQTNYRDYEKDRKIYGMLRFGLNFHFVTNTGK